MYGGGRRLCRGFWDMAEERFKRLYKANPERKQMSKFFEECMIEQQSKEQFQGIPPQKGSKGVLWVFKHWKNWKLQTSDPETSELATYIFAQEGKLLRPKFAMLLALSLMKNGCTTDDAAQTLLKVKTWSAVIEMIHNSSLLQDDIIDKASLRRGRPTAHTLFGKTKTAITPLFIKIIDLETPGLYKEYAMAISELPHGEYLQIFARKTIEKLDMQKEVPYHQLISNYLEKTHYKTGSLFTHLLKGTALICGVPHERLKYVDSFALNLGLSFQIADDLKDVVQTTDEMAKDALNDLRERNTTAPYLLALLQMRDEGRKEDVKELISGLKLKEKPQEIIEKIYKLVKSTDSISSTRNLISYYYSEADRSFLTILAKDLALSKASEESQALRDYSKPFLQI